MRLIFLDFDGVVHEARGNLEDDQYFEWLPILASLLISTLLGLLVTAAVMHGLMRLQRKRGAAS